MKLIAVLSVVFLLAAGCSSSDDSGSADDSDAESSTAVEDGQVGDVVETVDLVGGAALPSAARNTKITYLSEDNHGEIRKVSGTISVPEGEVPEGGWPMLSWAHGTVGVADACAPSADDEDGLAHDYLGLMDETLDQWVSNGYAVLQTDYQGLGTEGDHPYLIGEVEANNVIDIVGAARSIDEDLGTDWVASGHSQGGQASLFTAGAAHRDPELQPLGVIAISPPTHHSEALSALATGNQELSIALPFLSLVVIGSAAAEPSIDAESYFTEESVPLYELALEECILQLREIAPDILVKDAVNPDSDIEAIENVLAEQEPSLVELQVPTMIAQGTGDTLVFTNWTQDLVDSYCAAGADVVYKQYEGADHRGTVQDSFTDSLAYADSLRAGEVPASTC